MLFCWNVLLSIETWKLNWNFLFNFCVGIEGEGIDASIRKRTKQIDLMLEEFTKIFNGYRKRFRTTDSPTAVALPQIRWRRQFCNQRVEEWIEKVASDVKSFQTGRIKTVSLTTSWLRKKIIFFIPFRLRIAQEIRREQDDIDLRIKDFETHGVELEKMLRGEGKKMEQLNESSLSSIGSSDEDLLKELLVIWQNITQLKKRDEELIIRQQELQLEHRHAQLKEELSVRLSCSSKLCQRVV